VRAPGDAAKGELGRLQGSDNTRRFGRNAKQASMILLGSPPAGSCARNTSGAVTIIDRSVFVAAVFALSAPILATRSARMASMGPVAIFGALVASPESTARVAASASTGSDLPPARRSRRSGRGTSSTRTSRSMR
jgi:hypothetical protein